MRLPPTLPPLFPGLPRRLDVAAGSVDAVLAELDARWPGLLDRLCEPGPRLRQHIAVYVDGERAELGAPLAPGQRLDVVTAISGG